MPLSPSLRRLALAALGLLTPLAILAVLSPHVALSPWASFAVAFGACSVAIALCAALSPSGWLCEPRVAARVALVGALLVALSLVLTPRLSGLSGSLGLALVSLCVGSLVGRRVESIGHLPAVFLVSSAMDLWSVTSPSGPTRAVTRNPALLRLLTVSVVPPGDTAPHPVIGFADVAFAALYLAAVARFGLPMKRAAALVFLGLAASGMLAMTLQRPVPALPLLGAAVVLGRPETGRVPQRDRVATALAGLLLAVSFARAVTR